MILDGRARLIERLREYAGQVDTDFGCAHESSFSVWCSTCRENIVTALRDAADLLASEGEGRPNRYGFFFFSVAARVAGIPEPPLPGEDRFNALTTALAALPRVRFEDHFRYTEEVVRAADLLNPVHQVYFRAGLIACREYMARFVEAQDPAIANSIRANWWPSLGLDYGPPRQLAWSEVCDGEYGTPSFRVRTREEVSPTLEALPVAAGFLALPIEAASPASSRVEEHKPTCRSWRCGWDNFVQQPCDCGAASRGTAPAVPTPAGLAHVEAEIRQNTARVRGTVPAVPSESWSGDAKPENVLTVNFVAQQMHALADRWSDPEFWKDEGCRMDSRDCAEALRQVLAGSVVVTRGTDPAVPEEARHGHTGLGELAHELEARASGGDDAGRREEP